MIFDEEDAKVLRSENITTLLDLALCFPKNFDDLTQSFEPSEGENTVLVIPKSRTYKGSLFIINAVCVSWNCELKIVIFNSKSWHYSVFKLNKEIFIHGKSSFAYNFWQFTNPKIVTKIGEILPRYKKSIKDDKIAKITQKYINLSNLIKTGLSEEEAKLLSLIHI